MDQLSVRCLTQQNLSREAVADRGRLRWRLFPLVEQTGLALLAGLRHRVGEVAEGVWVEEIPALVAPER